MLNSFWMLDKEDECWVCSNCGHSALNDWLGVSTPSNFCPHCGKPMAVEEIESNIKK